MSRGLGLLQRQILKSCRLIRQRHGTEGLTFRYRGGRVVDGVTIVRHRDCRIELPPDVIDLKLVATWLNILRKRHLGLGEISDLSEDFVLDPLLYGWPAFSRAVKRLIEDGDLMILTLHGEATAGNRRFVRMIGYQESARGSLKSLITEFTG